MAKGPVLERLLRRDRAIVVVGLLLVIVVSWAYLLTGAGGRAQDMDGMGMPMAAASWSAGHALVMLVMWSVMMAAMMLPAAAPMILFYCTITRARNNPSIAVAAFVCGYLAVWSGFSVAAVALQFVLDGSALLSPMLQTTNATAAGVALIAAGLYQWTPLKHACLRRCRSPLEFVMTHWRGGADGAFVMGAQHGLYCVGCCWMLMLLLFVGGVMNLVWIGALAAFILVEKLAPAGDWIGRAAGALLLAWGVSTLL